MSMSNMTQLKVQYVDHMGGDLSVVRAATASFSKDPEEWDTIKHTRLINYLARGMTQADYERLLLRVASLGFDYFDKDDGNAHYAAEHLHFGLEQYRHTPTHWSPFAHATITLRLKAPIAIHAQFMKHTVGFAHNTVSRRYVSDTPELFLPTFRMAPQGNVKQGSGGEHSENELLQEVYQSVVQECLESYESMIKQGVAAEQARLILPQGVMTEWVSTGSLYAWARLFRLRTDSHAQKEIQDLAHMVGDIIKPLYPVSWTALTGA